MVPDILNGHFYISTFFTYHIMYIKYMGFFLTSVGWAWTEVSKYSDFQEMIYFTTDSTSQSVYIICNSLNGYLIKIVIILFVYKIIFKNERYTEFNLLFYHWSEVKVESSILSSSAGYIEFYQNNVAGMIFLISCDMLPFKSWERKNTVLYCY